MLRRTALFERKENLMKAMILAAGLGTRLKEITQAIPKCLVEAGGLTMIEHTIFALRKAGVDFVVINLHYLAERVLEFFSSKRFEGISINFSHEEDLLGTGGGLLNAAQFFQDCDAFVVHNADVYSTVDLASAIRRHRESKAIATLIVMEHESSRTLLFDRHGQLAGWRTEERIEPAGLPLADLSETAFTGIQILSPEIFPVLSDEKPPFSIISSYMKAAARGMSIKSYHVPSNAFWIDVGTPEKLRELQAFMESGGSSGGEISP